MRGCVRRRAVPRESRDTDRRCRARPARRACARDSRATSRTRRARVASTSTCLRERQAPAYCGWSRRTTNVSATISRPSASTFTQRGSIRADDHLAPPQEMQLVDRERRRQPHRDAAAGAAAIETQHEARAVARAARGERPQAEAAMQAAQRRRPHFGDREQRIPQAASRTRTPTSPRPSASRASVVGQRRRELLVGERARRIDRRERRSRASGPPRDRGGTACPDRAASASFERVRVARQLARARPSPPALRRRRLAVRAALAEQRRARDRIAHLRRRGRSVLLRALHRDEPGERQPRFAPRRDARAGDRRRRPARRAACRAAGRCRASPIGSVIAGKPEQRPERAARRDRRSSRGPRGAGAGRRRRDHRVESGEPLRRTTRSPRARAAARPRSRRARSRGPRRAPR